MRISHTAINYSTSRLASSRAWYISMEYSNCLTKVSEPSAIQHFRRICYDSDVESPTLTSAYPFRKKNLQMSERGFPTSVSYHSCHPHSIHMATPTCLAFGLVTRCSTICCDCTLMCWHLIYFFNQGTWRWRGRVTILPLELYLVTCTCMLTWWWSNRRAPIGYSLRA